MKRYILIFLLGLLYSCKKEADPEIPGGALYEVTAKGKLQKRLEYRNGRVSRVLAYSSCGTPYSIVEYGYNDGQITATRSGTRPLWSSWSGTPCDPDIALEYQNHTFQLDKQGRFSKVTGKYMTAVYEYSGQNATISIAYNDQNSSRISYVKFDGKGNVIEQSDADSGVFGIKRFEYDNNPNPMRGLNTYGLPDPFTCPNNVVRSLDSGGQVLWERKFTYNDAGWPLTCHEDNGSVYEYHYNP
ncbi:hypothetical protein [Dyadobacter sp. 676]|uniref:RHS repeat protein n=1 Tax=Dyadobacter sp. 676 TaxID=3088362 RepID=A0AAU8FGG6_9BACT